MNRGTNQRGTNQRVLQDSSQGVAWDGKCHALGNKIPYFWSHSFMDSCWKIIRTQLVRGSKVELKNESIKDNSSLVI